MHHDHRWMRLSACRSTIPNSLPRVSAVAAMTTSSQRDCVQQGQRVHAATAAARAARPCPGACSVFFRHTRRGVSLGIEDTSSPAESRSWTRTGRWAAWCGMSCIAGWSWSFVCVGGTSSMVSVDGRSRPVDVYQQTNFVGSGRGVCDCPSLVYVMGLQTQFCLRTFTTTATATIEHWDTVSLSPTPSRRPPTVLSPSHVQAVLLFEPSRTRSQLFVNMSVIVLLRSSHNSQTRQR